MASFLASKWVELFKKAVELLAEMATIQQRNFPTKSAMAEAPDTPYGRDFTSQWAKAASENVLYGRAKDAFP